MNRLCELVIGAGLAGGMAFAGQIQIGANNGANGLTAGYLGATSTTVGAVGNLYTASGGFTEQNYNSYLFKGATNGGTAPSAYTGYNPTSSNPATHAVTDTNAITGEHVTFNMIADGCGVTSATGTSCLGNDYWAAPLSGTSSALVIPINVWNVTNVWTILSNEFGQAGGVDTSVEFDFGTGPSTITQTLIVSLTNSGTGSTPSGQIRDSIDCTSSVGSNCLTYDIGPTSPNSQAAATLNGSSVVGGVQVLTDNIFTSAYNTIATNGAAYKNSQGNLTLTDQGFIFGNAFQGLDLIQIKVSELNGANQVSQTGLSAITVDATPEPSTMVLLFGGLGVVGFMGLRRRKQQA